MTNHPLDDAARFDQERNCIPPSPPVARVNKPHFDQTMRELFAERCRQERKHGATNLRKRAELKPLNAFLHWQQILGEELGEVSRAYLERDYVNMRKEMLEAAAVLIAMVEYGDADGWFPPKCDPNHPAVPDIQVPPINEVVFGRLGGQGYSKVDRRAPNNDFTRACWKGGPNMRADRRKEQRRKTRQAMRMPDRRRYIDMGNGFSPDYDRRQS